MQNYTFPLDWLALQLLEPVITLTIPTRVALKTVPHRYPSLFKITSLLDLAKWSELLLYQGGAIFLLLGARGPPIQMSPKYKDFSFINSFNMPGQFWLNLNKNNPIQAGNNWK